MVKKEVRKMENEVVEIKDIEFEEGKVVMVLGDGKIVELDLNKVMEVIDKGMYMEKFFDELWDRFELLDDDSCRDACQSGEYNPWR